MISEMTMGPIFGPVLVPFRVFSHLCHKMFVAFACDIAAESNALFGGAKFKAMHVAIEIAICVGAEQVNFVTVGTQSKARWDARGWIEIHLVNTRNPPAGMMVLDGDAEFVGSCEIVGQIPSAQVDVIRAWIIQFDRIRARSQCGSVLR